MAINYGDAWGRYTEAELQRYAAEAQELRRAIHAMTTLLQGGEWAEHVSHDDGVTALECEITKLIDKANAAGAGVHQSPAPRSVSGAVPSDEKNPVPASPVQPQPVAHLPRELMEACEAQAEDATMESFAQTAYADRIDRFTRTVYRMGFESGWRVRQEHPAAPPSLLVAQPVQAQEDAARLISEEEYELLRRIQLYARQCPPAGTAGQTLFALLARLNEIDRATMAALRDGTSQHSQEDGSKPAAGVTVGRDQTFPPKVPDGSNP
jgi:hypothetical protein